MFAVRLQDLVNELERISAGGFGLGSLLGVQGFVCWGGSGVSEGGDQ